MSSSGLAAQAAKENITDVVLRVGDLSKLSEIQRADYYQHVCRSLGLNPATSPLAYITLNNKMRLYALKDATDQLRKINRVSINISNRELLSDAGVYVVTAQATIAVGPSDRRTDEAIGATGIAGLKGEHLANAIMKAETKAKRRVTLSICGLGFLDESEVEGITAQPEDEDQTPVDLISDEHYKLLVEALDRKAPDTKKWTKRICDAYGVPQLSALPADKFDEVMAKIEPPIEASKE